MAEKEEASTSACTFPRLEYILEIFLWQQAFVDSRWVFVEVIKIVHECLILVKYQLNLGIYGDLFPIAVQCTPKGGKEVMLRG